MSKPVIYSPTTIFARHAEGFGGLIAPAAKPGPVPVFKDPFPGFAPVGGTGG